jgi:cytochrome P450|tara:strand:+ start:39508 stop:40827 length:1320 start_codon:yes stop_codon:yes gene_type:complete
MNRPPQLKGSPITGHYGQFKKDPIKLLLRASNELGDIFVLKAFSKSIYFVNHPDLIEYVSQTNYENYIKTPATPLRRILGDSIFTTDGEEWLQKRRLYQPALNNTAIKQYFSLVRESTAEMMEDISTETALHSAVNATRLMTNVTISVLGKTLFGSKLDFGQNIYGDIATIMEWISDRRLRHPFVVPISWPTASNKRFLAAVKSMDQMIYRIIDEKKISDQNPHDLLSRFMNPEEGSLKLSPKSLRDEVMTIFMAGHETSANVLNWTFYSLARHAEVQEKVFQEIISIENGPLVYDDLHALTYTSQVLQETMRMYPPVWHFGRVTREADKVGGYDIPAGTALRISPLTIHNRPEYWKNPEKFDPSRFDNPQAIKAFTHIPFGAGPRLCAGRNFAMMEMLLIITEVVKTYRLSYEGEPVQMSPMITLRSKGDISLVMEKR